jgi:solute carrier family 25 thiamine pyrophosphate transporter 19
MGKKTKKSKEGDGSINRGNKKLTQGQLATANAMAGALAGCIARFVVGPLDVLKIRFQVQLEPIATSGVKSKYTSLHQALVTIVKEEGIRVRIHFYYSFKPPQFKPPS